MTTDEAQATHTPGPWEVIPNGASSPTRIYIRRNTRGGEYVAEIEVASDLNAYATARLIAQAPTLLAQRDALLAALKAIVSVEGIEEALEDQIAQARAAIASVEGEGA